MNIEKALERLKGSLDHNTILITRGDEEALKLGIEALKWRQLMEKDYGSWCGPPLPGETED